MQTGLLNNHFHFLSDHYRPLHASLPRAVHSKSTRSAAADRGFLGRKFGPLRTIPGPAGRKAAAGVQMRMSDDPTTPVKALFWAGNSGLAATNVAISISQGQRAGAVAADELGSDDLAKLGLKSRRINHSRSQEPNSHLFSRP